MGEQLFRKSAGSSRSCYYIQQHDYAGGLESETVSSSTAKALEHVRWTARALEPRVAGIGAHVPFYRDRESPRAESSAAPAQKFSLELAKLLHGCSGFGLPLHGSMVAVASW